MNAEFVSLPMTLRDLSHVLRASLAGILGSIYFLNESSLTCEQQKYLRDINEAGERLLQLADYLLQAKRISRITPCSREI